jgi:hypothetical protein
MNHLDIQTEAQEDLIDLRITIDQQDFWFLETGAYRVSLSAHLRLKGRLFSGNHYS